MSERPDPDAVRFRTLAAPGLDEDEIFAVLEVGALWGQGMPTASPVAAPRPEDGDERGRRHRAALRRWPPVPPGA